ncbi:MAG: subtilisin-like proprotein convertase family protein, partial [Planctomycetaceae bacterium]
TTSANLTDGQEWGDYNGISVVDDLVIPAWTDNREGPPNEKDVFVADLDNLGAEPGFQLQGDNLQQLICAPDDLDTINLDVLSVQAFTNPVTLALQNEPAGVTSSFTVNPVVPADPAADSELTVSASGALSAGDYVFQVLGAATDASNKSLNIEMGVSTANAGTTTLVSPANAATDQPTSPTLSWSAAVQGTDYRVDIDDDPAFGSIDYQMTLSDTTHKVQSTLSPETTYYWRVRASNACGDGAFSTSFSFTTSLELCRSPNVAIPDGSAGGVDDSLVVTASGIISDLDVSLLASHTWVGDLVFTLLHEDTGTSVVMVDRPGRKNSGLGCNEDDIDLVLDDDAANPVETGCGSLNIGAAFSPNNAISAFNGEDIGGTWTLTAADLASGDTGTFSEWCLFPAINGSDSDGDGIDDDVDNCPDDSNPLQEDFDGDGLGYYCDTTCASSMDFIYNFVDGELFDLKASNSIDYEGTIASGADITLDGGGGVLLNPGTTVQSGALLNIQVTGCSP